MRQLILCMILYITSISLSIAQGDVEYTIKVIDNNMKPQAGLNITAIETSTLKVTEAKTNNNGVVFLNLVNGKKWRISVGEIKKCRTVHAKSHSILAMREKYIYDVKRYKRALTQDKYRSNENFKVIKQSITPHTKFEEGKCFLSVNIRNSYGSGVRGVNVSLVNVRDSLIYKGITNSRGQAYFIVPNKSNYEIDVNSLKNYSFCDFGDEYAKRNFDLEYIPTLVDEKVVNDTTFQKVDAASMASSERALLKVKVRGGKKKGIGEDVYLRELKTSKIYATKTDRQGYAYFLVPIHRIYMVDFRNQKNADAVSFMDETPRTATSGEIDVFYEPDPRLEYPETFIPTPNNLLIKEFGSFLTKQFERPKDKPFVLKILSALKINPASKEALFSLNLVSGDLNGKGVRFPLNISFVLDRSGSMYSDDRSESLKKTLWNIGHSLSDKDNVSLVLFNDEAVTVHESSKNHLQGFEKVIENYEPSGGTNIFSGLKEGVKNVAKNYSEKSNQANKVIVLTDGYGTTPPKEITDYVEKKYQEGIEFSTIGLGSGYNQSLLTLMARKGQGTFSGVDRSTDLSDTFLEQVKGSFNYFVKNLKVEILHNEKLIFSNLYGFPVDSKTNKSLSFNIKQLPVNTERLAFLKFKLNKPNPSIEQFPLIVKMSYFDLIQNKQVNLKQEVKLEWTEETNTELLFEQEEKTLYTIAILNQTLKTMAEAYEQEKVEKAKKHLEEGVAQINDIFPDAKPKEVKKLFDEVNKYLILFKQIALNKAH